MTDAQPVERRRQNATPAGNSTPPAPTDAFSTGAALAGSQPMTSLFGVGTAVPLRARDARASRRAGAARSRPRDQRRRAGPRGPAVGAARRGQPERADATARTQATATTEFKQAESIRDGKARASTDLETFYKQVLPADVAAARRMTHLRFQQKAREHNVQFQRGATSEEQLRDSSLDAAHRLDERSRATTTTFERSSTSSRRRRTSSSSTTWR